MVAATHNTALGWRELPYDVFCCPNVTRTTLQSKIPLHMCVPHQLPCKFHTITEHQILYSVIAHVLHSLVERDNSLLEHGVQSEIFCDVEIWEGSKV